MRYLNALFLLLVIVGGVNWLLVAVAKFDLVAALDRRQLRPDQRAVERRLRPVGIRRSRSCRCSPRWLSAPSAADH